MLDRAKRVQHTIFEQRGRGHVPQVGQCGGTGYQHRIDQTHSDPLPTERVGMRLDLGKRWSHISLTASDDVGGRAGKHTWHRIQSPLCYRVSRAYDHKCTPCGTLATRPVQHCQGVGRASRCQRVESGDACMRARVQLCRLVRWS